jgi:hypothetical protein
MESARHNQNKLICPHCGAAYQPGETVCPSCGKPLSPTGYSQYGLVEPPVSQPAPAITPRRAIPITPGELLRARLAPPAGLPAQPRRSGSGAAALLGVLVFAIFVYGVVRSNQSSRLYSYNQPVPPASIPTPGEFACTPPYANTFRIASNSAGQPLVLPHTSYMLTITTTRAALTAKMYDVGSDFMPFPPGEQFMNAPIAPFEADALTISTGDNASSTFVANGLAPQCGSLLLPVRGGRLCDDFMLIVTADAASRYPQPEQDTKGSDQTFLVVGQIISGYEITTRPGGSVVGVRMDSVNKRLATP